ncbi:MAG TPA: PAS domain-containing sensor histidine kinase [Rhizomicrobium sp.]|nr:PAS domain-containing sensor histidine kinase [Rhizomicrobium sp.]
MPPPNGWKHFDLAERAARFGYWRTTLADGKTFWSDGMYRLLGITPEEQAPDVGWLLDQIRPEDVERLQEAIGVAVKTHSPFQYRTQARYPTTSALIVDTYGEVEIGADDRVVAVVGVCHDVTAQVTAEIERERAQERYRLMAEEASDIIMLHENDRIVFASSALDRVLNRSPEEIQEGGYLKLVHPEDVGEAQRLRARPMPGETITATYRALHAQGHYVWIEATTRAIYHEETGEYLREISVSRDITERKEQELRTKAAQERAEAANHAKSQFLANMSHELRTPLNAIIGFGDIMRRRMFGELGDRRYEEYATLIYDSGQLLLDLISDILDMAKIEAGKLRLNYEHVDLAGIVEDCLRIVRQRAETAGVALEVVVPETSLGFLADKRSVKQVLLNLLSNAIKFTPAGGRIVVTTSNSNETVKVSVKDDGIGIPASELPRLGKPFEQVAVDPMLAKGGTGLGLALVQALVEKHGGSMRIDSEEGAGTEVRVEFPATPPSRNVAA